jgi:hypothetical protein
MTFVAAPSASNSAPVPRPPQPINPIRMGSSGAARPVIAKGNWETAATPARVSEDCFRKFRRERSTGDAAKSMRGSFIVPKIFAGLKCVALIIIGHRMKSQIFFTVQ